MEAALKFEVVEDPSVLLPVLSERLPISTPMYNQVIMYPKHQDDLRFYMLTKEDQGVSGDAWFVCSNTLQTDYNRHFVISAPAAVDLEEISIPPDVVEAFAVTDVLDWEDRRGQGSAFILGMTEPVALRMFDLLALLPGKNMEVFEMGLWTLDKEKALQFEVTAPSGYTVRRLKGTSQDARTVIAGWELKSKGPTQMERMVTKCLDRNASAGVFTTRGGWVSSVYAPAMGVFFSASMKRGVSFTDFEATVLRCAFKEFAKDNCIPCYLAPTTWESCVKLYQEELGMTPVSTPLFFLDMKSVKSRRGRKRKYDKSN